ncbi:MAG: M16 family metallopeptidase [Helicobacteraceae bacterium]
MTSYIPAHSAKTLKNGLQIVTVPLKNGSGVVSVDIFYKVGSKNETLGKSGIAHMLEHMNFKSTKNFKAGEFDRIVKNIGGVNNASTGFDWTHYYVKTTRENLPKILPLYRDMMSELLFLDDEFLPERSVVREEKQLSNNDVFGFLYFKLFNTAFSYHPYHWTPIGFIKDIEHFTAEDLRSFYKTFYQPNNAVLVMSGDLSESAAQKAAQETFGALKSAGEIKKSHIIEPEQTGARRADFAYETENDVIAIAYKTPPVKHKDTLALEVLAEILSQGNNSRLQKNVIDKKQVASSAEAYSLALQDGGLFILSGVCASGARALDLERALLQEVKALKARITQKELNKVKLNLKFDLMTSFGNSSSTSSIFGSYIIQDNLEALLSYEQDLESLDLGQLKAVANTYLNAENSTTITLKKGSK